MANIIAGIVNQFFLAGTILLLIFTVLSGSTNHSPINKFYWIHADTSAIAGAYSTSSWTFWAVCDYNDLSQCTSGPAYPISPVDNFHTTDNVPKDFVTSRKTYFYLSRFSFAFTLIALALTAIVFLLGFVVLAKKTIVFLVSLALFFLAGAVAFQTSVVVLARNAFHSQGLDATVGIKLMAIFWTSFVTLLIVWVNSLSAKIVSSYRQHLANVKGTTYNDPVNEVSGPVGPVGDESSFTRETPAEAKEDNSGGIRFFKIKRNHKASDEESV